MPSPIVHTFLGYLVYKQSQGRLSWRVRGELGRMPVVLIVAVFFSLLPDLDSVLGLLARDFGRFHNGWSHSLLTGLAAALILAALLRLGLGSSYWNWFWIGLVSYELHVLADFFTRGRGVMLFWPLSEARFISPLILFYGVRWSEGLLSPKHLWTLVSELASVGAAYYVITWLRRRQLAAPRARPAGDVQAGYD